MYVSELGLGTQRWGGDDFNSPDEALCHAMLDYAVLERGVNLVDTAEQVCASASASASARARASASRVPAATSVADESRPHSPRPH